MLGISKKEWLFFFSLTLLSPSSLWAEDFAGKAVSVAGSVLMRNEDSTKTSTQVLKPGTAIEKGSVINTGSNGMVKLLMTDKSIIDLGPSTLFKIDEYKLKNQADRVVGMSLPYGKIRASVNVPVSAKGRYTIRTRSATMGVRGTEFVVAADLGDFLPDTPPAPAEKPAPGKASAATKPAAAPAKPAAPRTQITVIQGKVEVKETSAPKKSEPIKLTEGTQLTTVAAPAAKEAVRGLASVVKVEPPKIVKLTVAEVKAVQIEAKQVDHTFTQAVVLDNSAIGSGRGAETLAAINESFNMPKDYAPPTAGNMGFAGTFGSDFGMHQNIQNTNTQGMPVHLKVVFKK